MRWVGSSLEDLKALPPEVQDETGFILDRVQRGKYHPNIKPLKGLSGVQEIRVNFDRDTYRTIYVVNLGDFIYVLHAFKKKSKRGAATPKHESAHRRMQKMKSDTEITRGSGNVFADLDLPKPRERLLKARLASLILEVIQARGWTQKHAADVLGITQPDVSAIVSGRLKNFSVERLMYFLAKLDNRVTITVSGEELPAQEIVVASN